MRLLAERAGDDKGGQKKRDKEPKGVEEAGGVSQYANGSPCKVGKVADGGDNTNPHNAEHDNADQQQAPVRPAAQPVTYLRQTRLGDVPVGRAIASGNRRAITKEATPMRTASPMNCIAGVIPSAPHAAPSL